jgi:hypothetical protein
MKKLLAAAALLTGLLFAAAAAPAGADVCVHGSVTLNGTTQVADQCVPTAAPALP